MKVSSSTLILIIGIIGKLFSQEITCRQWYYKKDVYGNEIKDVCKEAWQQNEYGQKHGRYIHYLKDGNVAIAAGYKDNVLHGKYISYVTSKQLIGTEFSGYSGHIIDSGRYVNGNRNGWWLLFPNNVLYRNNALAGGSAKRQMYARNTTGQFESSGYYSGDIVFWKSLDKWSNRNFQIAFERAEICPNGECLNLTAESSAQINKSLDDLKSYAHDNNISTERIVLITKFKNGDLETLSNMLGYINGEDYDLKSVEDFLAKNEAEKKLRESEKRMKADAIEAGEISSISFTVDSYKIDEQGINLLAKFLSLYETLDADAIKSFIIIGHAGADKKLGKVTFDPKNHSSLYDKQGRRTAFSEHDLADLRLVLSIGRCKTFFNEIKEIELTKTLIDQQKLWMFPAGTVFGHELQYSNQNIVQVVIILENGKVINTTPNVPYGAQLKGPSTNRINQHIRDLGYNFTKLIQGLLSFQTFDKPIPEYMELAINRERFLNFTNRYR